MKPGLLRLVVASAWLTACSGVTPQKTDPGVNTESVGFIAFGDSGYDLDWPTARDRKDRPATPQAWYELHRDSRGTGDYKGKTQQLPDLALSPVTGGYVLDTGLPLVSAAIAQTCTEKACDFAMMMGDNIYPSGADGIDDSDRFEQVLARPFGNLGAGDPDFAIYAALGNHDWKTSREGALAQLEFHQSTPPFYMDGFSYSVKPTEDIELFIFDSQLLLASTEVYTAMLDDEGERIRSDDIVAPWPWVIPQSEAEGQIAQWLERSLRESTARWKIVMAHHPLWSSAGGKHAQAEALRRVILPALCRHADAYLAGHEHTLEVHQYDCASTVDGAPAEPLPQLVSGAASKQRGVNDAFRRWQDEADPALQTLYAAGMVWGYAHLVVSGEHLSINLINVKPDGERQSLFTAQFNQRDDAP